MKRPTQDRDHAKSGPAASTTKPLSEAAIILRMASLQAKREADAASFYAEAGDRQQAALAEQLDQLRRGRTDER